MRQYLDAVREILNTGTRKENRTGVDTLSTFGIYYEIDLRLGFPLLTTKRMNWKNIVVETLWFLSGEPSIGILQKHGCKFWDAWADEDGNVPSAYGSFWTRFPAEHRLAYVPPRVVKAPVRPLYPIVQRHFAHNPGPFFGRLAGQVFQSAKCSSYTVIEQTGNDEQGRSLHTIQFKETGYTARNIRADVVQNGQVKDPFYPSVYGIGYRGANRPETDLDKDLYKVWSHMLERCYLPTCKEYVLYGEKGVFVDASWWSWTQFRKDCIGLPNWRDKKERPKAYQIDKDYYGSNCYSKDTCVWLTKRDNVRYQKARAFEVMTPSGDTFIDISRNDVAEAYDLSATCIGDVLAGRQGATKGFRFRFLENGKNYRYGLPNDQIAWVIDQLKTNPMSRRLVVSAWAPGNAQTSKLPPCHALMVFNVQLDENGEKLLCLHLTQRSCDIALGVPYNIAGYAFLLELFAQLTGLKAGIFAHALVDAHAYTRKPDGSMAEFDHVPGLREQLTREPRPLPRIEIDSSVKTLADIERIINMDDTGAVMDYFRLENYHPAPAIKFKVAV